MTKAGLIIFLLLALVSCDTALWGPKKNSLGPHPAKKYRINLDDSYTKRWSQIMTENKKEILDLITIALRTYAPEGTPDIPDSVIQAKDPEFYAEIKAISNLLGVSVNSMFMLNVMYEAYAFCTSIVVQDSNGLIFHGRNLDYGFTTQISKVSFDVDFYKNGKLLFRGNILGGIIGLITAEKPGKFSISANQRMNRFANSVQYWDRIIGKGVNMFEIFFNKRKGILLTIFNVMEYAETYQQAIKALSSTPLAAPAYYIVSGVNQNEGAVLSMGRDGVVDVATLDVNKGIWYLVQTNYDRDIADPASDSRRVAAEKRMNAVGRRNINFQNLLDDVLGLYPSNNEQTILSAVYSSKVDYWNMTVWV